MHLVVTLHCFLQLFPRLMLPLLVSLDWDKDVNGHTLTQQLSANRALYFSVALGEGVYVSKDFLVLKYVRSFLPFSCWCSLPAPWIASKGLLPHVVDTSNRRIDVIDVSNNSGITGAVPTSYSDLLMLFAESTSLSGPGLPLFIDAISTTEADGWKQESTTHNLSVCPGLQLSGDQSLVAATLDPSYDGYSFCTCNDG